MPGDFEIVFGLDEYSVSLECLSLSVFPVATKVGVKEKFDRTLILWAKEKGRWGFASHCEAEQIIGGFGSLDFPNKFD